MTRQFPLARLCVPACALLAAFPGRALALDPAQVFKEVSPSVWMVKTYDEEERPVSQGSAVVIGPGRLITNCHVLASSSAVWVRRENVMYKGKLEYADTKRDLCQLQVDNFNAPAVQILPTADVQVGERVYAIGSPKGLELTLSDGLVSALRTSVPGLKLDPGGKIIQTNTPVSHGSSGGGLFDSEGRLIGITSDTQVNAQNINYALPADWIAQVPERAKAALAKHASAPQAAVASAAPGLPAAGTSWTYGYSEKVYGTPQLKITMRVVRVDGTSVEESVSSGANDAGASQRTIGARDSRFFVYSPASGDPLVELAPYLVAVNDGKDPPDFDNPSGYPRGGGGLPGWAESVEDKGWEQVTVPAGSYRALRLEVSGRRIGHFHTRAAVTGRFHVTTWYAPAVRRVVKVERLEWSADAYASSETGDYVLELLTYRPAS